MVRKIRFFGEFNHSLDGKNRLIVPARFREQLGDTFYVTRGNNKCLAIYTEENFDAMMDGVDSLPQMDPDVLVYARQLGEFTSPLQIDKQGRIILPQNLLDLANIKKDVKMIGVSTRIEIWDPQEYEKWTANPTMTDKYDLAAQKVSEMFK